MTLYRMRIPAVSEPIHWQWLDELVHAKILVEVAIDPVEMGRHVVATGAYIAGLTNGDLQDAVEAAMKDVE